MSTYYTAPPTVIDGDVAFAKDVNDINNAADTGFALVEAEIVGISGTVQFWADKAEDWAEKAEDSQVESGKYSAKHHAAKSQASATSASGSSSSASGFASSASGSASSALGSASSALGSANTATAKAQLAADYAQKAEDSQVETGTYSAYHWSKKAQAYAADAVESVTGTGVDNTDPKNPVITIDAIESITGTVGEIDVDSTDPKNPIISISSSFSPPTVPVGSILAFIGGYFTNGSNAGFTSVLGNTVSAVNTLLNSDGWYVCNGAALNLSGSSIFNGSGRYLPNITDSRFLMGSTGAGTIGGDNAMAHTHTTSSFTLTTNEIPSHRHSVDFYNGGGGAGGEAAGLTNPSSVVGSFYTKYTGTGAAHNHGVTDAASVTENRPLFLSCLYIMKVQ